MIRAIHVCGPPEKRTRVEIKKVPYVCKKCGTRLEAPHLEEKEASR